MKKKKKNEGVTYKSWSLQEPIINNVEDEIHTFVPCKKRCDSCTNLMIAKSSFECFVTKRVYEELHLLKPILRNFKSHINKKLQTCSICNHVIDVCSDTDDPSRNIKFIIIDQLNNTNSLSHLMKMMIYCYKKKDFRFQRLPPHKNSTHHWNRKRRTERLKQR